MFRLVILCLNIEFEYFFLIFFLVITQGQISVLYTLASSPRGLAAVLLSVSLVICA